MRNPKEIVILHTANGYQVQFAGLVIGEYTLLDEAKLFAISYPYGLGIEIWGNGIMVENISKVI